MNGNLGTTIEHSVSGDSVRDPASLPRRKRLGQNHFADVPLLDNIGNDRRQTFSPARLEYHKYDCAAIHGRPGRVLAELHPGGFRLHLLDWRRGPGLHLKIATVMQGRTWKHDCSQYTGPPEAVRRSSYLRSGE